MIFLKSMHHINMCGVDELAFGSEFCYSDPFMVDRCVACLILKDVRFQGVRGSCNLPQIDISR